MKKILIILVFLSFLILPWKLDGKIIPSSDSIACLSKIKGADMALFQIYTENKDGDRDKAADHALLFLSRLDSTVSSIHVAHICDWLADYYEMDKFLFSKAIRWRETALRHYTAIDDIYGKARAEYCLSILYWKKNQYHKVLKYADDATRLFQQLHCSNDVMECYKILGVAYKTCGDIEKSDEYFQAYAREAKILEDSVKIARSMNNLAAFASSINDTAKAIRFTLEAIEYVKGRVSDTEMCKFYLNTAAVFTEAGQYEKSKKYLEMARPILNNIDLTGHYYTIYGLMYYMQEKKQEAILNLETAVNAYSQGEFEQQLSDIFGLLNRLYRDIGDLPKAYEYLQKMYDYESTLDHDGIMMELFQTQKQIETAAFEKTIEDGRNRLTIITVISVSGMIVLALCAFTVIKRKSWKVKEKETVIESQRRLTEEKRLYSMRVGAICRKAAAELAKIAKDIKDPQAKKKITAVCAELSETKKNDIIDEIKSYIPDFDDSFYKKLSKEFPNLTNNESRICILLNKNMSTKQISEITRQSPESINLARTRLRRKLGIAGENISIQEFLRQFNT